VARPKQLERRELWRQRIKQQESSQQSIRAFCREHKLNEHSFYSWRQRLLGADSPAAEADIRFALVEPVEASASQLPQHVEFILTTGERLRIPADVTTIRLVLNALRQQQLQR
jgi:hypothetical protein